MALSEYPTVDKLKELATKHGDLEITKDDSLNAGNCESGTDEFIEECFEGRESVKVSELVEHIDGFPGVRSVLEYRFRQLEEQAEEKPEAKAEE